MCAGCLTSHDINGDLANMVEGVQSFSWPDIVVGSVALRSTDQLQFDDHGSFVTFL